MPLEGSFSLLSALGWHLVWLHAHVILLQQRPMAVSFIWYPFGQSYIYFIWVTNHHTPVSYTQFLSLYSFLYIAWFTVIHYNQFKLYVFSRLTLTMLVYLICVFTCSLFISMKNKCIRVHEFFIEHFRCKYLDLFETNCSYSYTKDTSICWP